jgi:hypothetical protein
MQREMGPYNIDVVSLAEFFNTPGTEITPGSDVVGENLQDKWLSHAFLLRWMGAHGMDTVS